MVITSWFVISADPSSEYTTIFQHFMAIICPTIATLFTLMKAHQKRIETDIVMAILRHLIAGSFWVIHVISTPSTDL
jgi:hypothetical protein